MNEIFAKDGFFRVKKYELPIHIISLCLIYVIGANSDRMQLARPSSGSNGVMDAERAEPHAYG